MKRHTKHLVFLCTFLCSLLCSFFISITPSFASSSLATPSDSQIATPAVPVPVTATASDSKKEITAIKNRQNMTKARLFTINDAASLNKYVKNWLSSYHTICGLTADKEVVFLTPENITTEGIDIAKAGEYTLTVKLKISDSPDSYFISDELATLSIRIGVQDPDEFELFYLDCRAAGIRLLWSANLDLSAPVKILFIENGTQPLSGKALDSAKWTLCDDEDFAGVNVYTKQLFISAGHLVEHMHYYVKLQQNDRTSSIIHFVFNNENTVCEGIGGNRDGGDLTEPKPPIQTQPAPDPPDKTMIDSDFIGYNSYPSNNRLTATDASPVPAKRPSAEAALEETYPAEPPKTDTASAKAIQAKTASQAETASDETAPANSTAPAANNLTTPSAEEKVTEDQTVISGARIQHLLILYPDYIPFSHHGILLRIPCEFFKSMDLSDDEMLTVSLYKKGPDAFTLSIYRNHKELTDIPPSQIQFPIGSDITVPITLYRDGVLEDLTVTVSDQLAIFDITQTGNYILRPAVLSTENSRNIEPDVMISILFFAVLGLITLFYRRRAKRYGTFF